RVFELRLPDGSAPERATLEFQRFGDQGYGENGTWTPADPAVELPSGDWVVTAASGDDASRYRSIQNARFVSEPTNVLSPPGDGSDAVKLELHGRCAIEGRILPPAVGTRFYYVVHALRLEPGQTAEPELFLEWFRKGGYYEPRADVQSDRERGLVYRLDRLEPG